MSAAHSNIPKVAPSEIEVIAYEPAYASDWNRLARTARNAHFLFNRRFMEYHAARFHDASLLFFEKTRLLGALPAERDGDTLYSHRGLTFGGIIAADRLTAGRMLGAFDALRRHLRRLGVTSLLYKAMPHIYHRRPAEEDLYALFRQGAELVRRDIATAIDYAAPGIPAASRRRNLHQVERQGVSCGEADAWAEFWSLLERSLAERYSTRPVHSLAEICLLRERFPEAIRLFVAYAQSGAMVAGVVIFETPQVAHVQYAAISAEGRRMRALDGLYTFLIDYYCGTKRWFDFGISSYGEGRLLNEGLVRQKEAFGGSSIAYDVYRCRIE